MTIIFSEHLLIRAREYLETAFKTVCYFLDDCLPISMPGHGRYRPITEAELTQILELATQFYDRYNTLMQFYRFYAEMGEQTATIIPLHPMRQ